MITIPITINQFKWCILITSLLIMPIGFIFDTDFLKAILLIPGGVFWAIQILIWADDKKIPLRWKQ